MTTDQFIEFLSVLCTKLLPILGVVVLVFVIQLLRKMIQFFVNLQKTLSSVDSTIGVVEEQIRKLDAPLNTVNEFSQTLDTLHEMGQNALKSALMSIIANLNVIRDWLMNHGDYANEAEPTAKTETTAGQE